MAIEVSALAAPVYELVRTAAVTDAQAAQLLERIEAARSERMRHNAASLVERGWLRPGVTAEQARDVLMFATAELYPAFVERAGWRVEDYEELLYRFLRAALLP
jgi:hypothetical protein